MNKELAQKAIDLYDALILEFDVDMRKMRAGDHAENLRIGIAHRVYGLIFSDLVKQRFNLERIRLGTFNIDQEF